MTRAIAMLAALLLAGCASFQEPTAGPRARVRFVSDAISPSVLYHFADASCDNGERMANMKNGTMVGSATKRLGMPLWDGFHENAAKEFYLPAGVTFYGAFRGRNLKDVSFSPSVAVPNGTTVTHTYGVCSMPFAFAPDADADYELRFETAGDECHLRLYELKSGARVPQPALLKPIDRSACASVLKSSP